MTIVPPARCMTCLKILDAATSVQGVHVPEKDSFSVCYYCGTVSKYDKDLNLVPLTDEDLEYLKKHPDILVILKGVGSFIQEKNANN